MRKLLLSGFMALCFAAGLSAQTATFVKADTTTRGTYVGVYGQDGLWIATHPELLPGYATVSVVNASTWTWSATPANAGNVSSPPTCWYTAPATTPFTFNVNLTDSKTHTLALYAEDWDPAARAETVTIKSPTGAVLSSQSISGFAKGVYLVWNISGNVIITVAQTAGVNAVVSGLFFSTPGVTPPPTCNCVHSVALAWAPVSGATSYQVLRGTVSGGPYTLLSTVTASTYTDTSVVAGTTYYYVTDSVSAGGTSGYSVQLTATIPSP
jgi:hypothetical protein